MPVTARSLYVGSVDRSSTFSTGRTAGASGTPLGQRSIVSTGSGWPGGKAFAATGGGVCAPARCAMMPAASVSGLYFAGKCSSYFAVGKITQEQVADYALRKKMDGKEAERWLATSLNYEP